MRRLWLFGAALLVGVAGCSQSVADQVSTSPALPTTPVPSVAAPSPDAAAAAACTPVMAALPQTADDLARSRSEKFLVAYGTTDPVTVRCGVAKPSGLDATATCDEINGVGWFTENASWGYTFTTIGRSAYLEVRVPASNSPAANALIDLTPAVKQLKLVKPCI